MFFALVTVRVLRWVFFLVKILCLSKSLSALFFALHVAHLSCLLPIVPHLKSFFALVIVHNELEMNRMVSAQGLNEVPYLSLSFLMHSSRIISRERSYN